MACEFLRVVRLFSDHHTIHLQKRQALALRKLARDHANGFTLNEIDDAVKVLKLGIASVEAGQIELIDSLCEYMLIFGRRKHPLSSYKDAHEKGVWLPMLDTIAFSLSTRNHSVKELRETAAATIRAFIHNQNIAFQVPIEVHHTIPNDYSSCRDLIIVNQSGIIPTLVQSLTHCQAQISLIRLLRDISLSSLCCVSISASHHFECVIHRLLSLSFKNDVIPLVVEVIWNMMELTPLHTHIICSETIVFQLTDLLQTLLEQGYSARDKALCNQVLAVLLHIARRHFISLLVRSQCLHIILTHCILLENTSITCHNQCSNYNVSAEDISAKKLMWSFITEVVIQPRCLALCVQHKLVNALTIYTDISCRSTLLLTLTQPALNELTLCAFSLLFALAPLLPRTYSQLQINDKLVHFVKHHYQSKEKLQASTIALHIVHASIRAIHQSSFEHLSDNCEWLLNNLLHIYDDVGRPILLRSQAVCILSQLCINNASNKRCLRKLGGFDTILSTLQQQYDEEILLPTLECLLTVITDEARNIAYILSSDGINCLMSLSCRVTYRLRRLILACIDDILLCTNTRRAQRYIKEFHNSQTRQDSVTILLTFWKEEQHRQDASNNCISNDELNIGTSVHTIDNTSLKMYSSSSLCRPHIQQYINEEQKRESELASFSTIQDARIVIASILNKLGGESIHSLTAEQRATMREVIRFSELQIGSAWENIQQKVRQQRIQLVHKDSSQIDEAVIMSHNILHCVHQKQYEDIDARSTQDMLQYHKFVDTVRAFIAQESSPPDLKANEGGTFTVIPAKLKLSKEHQREMIRVALQKQETNAHLTPRADDYNSETQNIEVANCAATKCNKEICEDLVNRTDMKDSTTNEGLQ